MMIMSYEMLSLPSPTTTAPPLIDPHATDLIMSSPLPMLELLASSPLNLSRRRLIALSRNAAL